MCLLLASTAEAQDPPPQSWQVRVLEEGADAGLELLPLDRPDGLISQLSWTPPGGEEPIVVTLVRPVQDCAAAITGDDNALVVLAGGIRDSLDLYLIDRREPQPFVLETSGGRRLPESFNGGLGSWPLVEGPHLALFAFEKERRLEFRALDFPGRIYDTHDMPFEEVSGFSVESDLESNELRARFEPIGEVRAFPHPLAPRLDLVGQGLLTFGSPLVGREVFREVEVRNSGARDLRVTASVSGAGFRIDGSGDLVLEPEGIGMVRVGFTPDTGGSFDGQLELLANSPSRQRRVALRGEGLQPGMEAPPAAPPDPAADEPPAETPPDPADPAPFPSRPQVRFLQIDPLSPVEVSVTGMLRLPAGSDAAAVELQGADQTVRATLGPGGAFQLRAKASPGEWLRLASVNGNDAVSPSVVVGQVLPAVRRVGGWIEIRTRPGARFMLTAVALDADDQRVQRLWAAWEGHTDAMGIARVDLETFGPRRVPLHVLVFADSPQGMRRSNLLRLDPDF